MFAITGQQAPPPRTHLARKRGRDRNIQSAGSAKRCKVDESDGDDDCELGDCEEGFEASDEGDGDGGDGD